MAMLISPNEENLIVRYLPGESKVCEVQIKDSKIKQALAWMWSMFR